MYMISMRNKKFKKLKIVISEKPISKIRKFILTHILRVNIVNIVLSKKYATHLTDIMQSQNNLPM